MESLSLGNLNVKVTYFKGEVVEVNRTSETVVSGSTNHQGVARVSSAVHRDQTVWVKAKNGEERTFEFDGHDIRAGNEITVISAESDQSKKSHSLFLVNHNTRKSRELVRYDLWYRLLRTKMDSLDVLCVLSAWLVVAYIACQFFDVGFYWQSLYDTFVYSGLFFGLFILGASVVGFIIGGALPALFISLFFALIKTTIVDKPKVKELHRFVQQAAAKCLQPHTETQA